MPNRYLADNFAPVHTELTAFDLPVTGNLPEHLDGRYLRNGPNPAEDLGPQHHWFLGQGMVHGVRIAGGRAEWYRNRWVKPQGEDHGPNTNVVQHAGATNVVVELSFTGRTVLRVRDDGRGFTTVNHNGRNRLGVSGMRERALLVGGNLTIFSTPGEGTTIELTMGAT